MAPIFGLGPTYDNIPNLHVSSLELDRRSTPSSSINTLLKRLDPFTSFSQTSPPVLSLGSTLRARDAAPAPPPRGAGTFDPNDINNRGILALFGILSAAFVIASIWFFFWAKNGGFRWRKNDWSEYKSTVLRRKGPNGTTLSGATKSTKLGGGSIVGTLDGSDDVVTINEKVRRGKKGKKSNRQDDDVRAYRHEKPAKVGGLNREADGSYHDYTATEASEMSSYYTPSEYHTQAAPKLNPKLTKPTKKETARVPSSKKEPKTPTKKHFSPYKYPPSASSTDSHRPLRASQDATPTRSRQSSPRKHASNPHRHSRASERSERSDLSDRRVPSNFDYTEPLDFESRYTASETGTKAYFHPIPGLGRSEKKTGGFRRGGGRRDSLSDSEGEGSRMS